MKRVLNNVIFRIYVYLDGGDGQQLRTRHLVQCEFLFFVIIVLL